MAYQMNEKKKALLASKEQISREIKYYEKRIEDAHNDKTNQAYFEDDDDDSDTEMVFTLDTGPSVHELKSQQTLLQTCLNATQELTSLYVLQSEVNVMVNDPVYEREPPVSEAGCWREVTADCKVDLVPFSITFYVHQASRPFGGMSYRGLRVVPVKAAHGCELARSVLPRVSTPSDAVEVLRGYAAAHRSRRATLARLAERYPDSLFMEPVAEGGYELRCGELLRVRWTLDSRRSHLAPFQHRMTFDLEYMDEAYVKIISQAHKELSDPALQSDERTHLMSKIIATCLEARGPTQELYESMESDVESEKLRKRRTTLDHEIEEPVHKKNKDSEVMAPPKSLPKKTKPKSKGKENNVDNNKLSKPVKRPMTDIENGGAKKVKSSNQDDGKKGVSKTKNNANTENMDKIDKVTGKKRTDKEATKSKSNKEKIADDTVKPIQDIPKQTDSNNKTNANNVADLKNNKFGNVNTAGRIKSSDKVSEVKSKDVNLNNNSDKQSNVIASKKIVDKETIKGKSSAAKSSNKVSDTTERNKTVDPNKILNSKKTKSNKEAENVQETNNLKKASTLSNEIQNNGKPEDSNKPNRTEKVKSTKVTKNVKESDSNNPENSNKVTNTKRLNSNKIGVNLGGAEIERPKDFNKISNAKKTNLNKVAAIQDTNNGVSVKVTAATEQNSEESSKSQVSNNENIPDKVKNKKTNDNIMFNKNNNFKAKSAGRVKDTVTRVEDVLTKEKNTNNEKNNKNTERPKSDKPSVPNPENIKSINKNTKATINMNKKTINMKSNDNAESKSKEIINNKAKSSNKGDKYDNIAKVNKEVISDKEESNRPVLDKENIIIAKQIPSISGLNKENNKLHQTTDKTLKKPNSVTKIKNLKQHDTLQEIVVSNSTKSKNTDKIMARNDKNNIITNEDNVDSIKKHNDRNVAIANKKTTPDMSERNSVELNTGRSSLQQKKYNKQITSNTTAMVKTIYSNTKTIISKATQNNMNVLIPKNKLSVGKPKLSNNGQKETRMVQKEKGELNRTFTKIPRKLMSVRDQIVKNNPLRSSPRTYNTNMKINSQDVSKSSQHSLQKAVTGIPRLLKKPMHKK